MVNYVIDDGGIGVLKALIATVNLLVADVNALLAAGANPSTGVIAVTQTSVPIKLKK